MKLNWFSPLPPARTDIANYTRRMLTAIQGIGEVTLWTDQAHVDDELSERVSVRLIEPGRPQDIGANADEINIYNIGNDPHFHGPIWQMSLAQPGIVILHDIKLQHFFAGLYLDRWRDLDGYLTQLAFYYGDDGRARGREFYERALRGDGSYIDELSEHCPMTYLALENALGVMVHTRQAFDSLAADGLLPVAYSPLPFVSATEPRPSPLAVFPTPKPPYRLITFGFIGPNRCLDDLLSALAASPHGNAFHLDIYGQLWDEDHIRSSIGSLGLNEQVTIHGFVSEAELDSALSTSDLAINLRYPTMGEASGSQLRIWAHGLPSLVTRTGWYSTLDEGTVLFVEPQDPVRDIGEHLARFVQEPGTFKSIGECGRDRLYQDHTTESCAAVLSDLIQDAQTFPRPARHDRLIAFRKASMGKRADHEEGEVAQLIAKKDRLVAGRSRPATFSTLKRLAARLRASIPFRLGGGHVI